MVPAGVPQLHVGLGEPVVDVEVGRLELEDAHHVRRAVLLRYRVLRRVRDEVGEHGLAGLGNIDRQCWHDCDGQSANYLPRKDQSLPP